MQVNSPADCQALPQGGPACLCCKGGQALLKGGAASTPESHQRQQRQQLVRRDDGRCVVRISPAATPAPAVLLYCRRQSTLSAASSFAVTVDMDLDRMTSS